MFTRFMARLRLRIRGYCGTHGEKLAEWSGPGGLHMSCSECQKEQQAKDAAVVARSKSILGFK